MSLFATQNTHKITIIMHYSEPLQEARLIKRYKRFLADAQLTSGKIITLHCPNTGSMKNCLYPEHKIWYSISDNPKRKHPYTWEQAEIPVQKQGKTVLTRVGINTHQANKLVEEHLNNFDNPDLAAYQTMLKEVRYGNENSRIDFLLTQDGLPDCYIEVKSVTLAMENGLGLFPDAITTRGTKHLRELMGMVEAGHRAILLFCVQHGGIDHVSIAQAIDPIYAETFKLALKAGVEIQVWGCELTNEKIKMTHPLPFV